MRLLIHGMQSSGASLFSFLMSQEPETLAIVDCWGGIVPAFDDYAGDWAVGQNSHVHVLRLDMTSANVRQLK
jgi:hypothetical protein